MPVLVQNDFDRGGIFSRYPNCGLHFPIASVMREQRISSGRNIVEFEFAVFVGVLRYSMVRPVC